MSSPLTRTYSLRKPVRPLIDIDEDEDNQRRDPSGRKRVDVVECLLDSSSDDLDEIVVGKSTSILRLTFHEICHIRCVLAETQLSLLLLNDDKQYWKIRSGHACFRCRRKLTRYSFLFSFLRFIKHDICSICRQAICKTCSFAHFRLPPGKQSIPVRVQTLIRPASTSIDHGNLDPTESHADKRTVCYDCLQIFHEYNHVPQPPANPFRRTLSLPPLSSHRADETRYTRYRRRPDL